MKGCGITFGRKYRMVASEGVAVILQSLPSLLSDPGLRPFQIFSQDALTARKTGLVSFD